MLFVLTGEIQTGKTRWLERLTGRLAAEGVRCAGVLAPGVWRPRDPAEGLSAGECAVGSREGGAFEKRGIDNVLIPSGERVAFARRADLAQRDGALDPGSQAVRAGLGWAIDDGAIARVNAHFAELARDAAASGELEGAPRGLADACGGSCGQGRPCRALLVVDELGRLELMRGEGLTQAMALLDRGPTRAFPHALVVVRAALLPLARERFEPVWGIVRVIEPNDEGARAVRAALAL